MLQQFDSSLLPVEHNTKLQDSEGLTKQITNQQYQKILSKAKSLNPIRDLLHRTTMHSEFGIVQFVVSLLKLYLNSNGNSTVRVKKTQQQQSQRFQAMTLEQEEIMFTLQQVLELEYNPEILLRRLKVTPIETNLFFILLITLYNTYILTNQDSTRVIQWIGIVYDASFLKICLDERIKQTLRIVERILSNEIESQKQELEVLSIIGEITDNVGYYQELRDKPDIEMVYIGF